MGNGSLATGFGEAKQFANVIESELAAIRAFAARAVEYVERTQEQVSEDQYSWYFGAANSGATTTADVELAAPPPGSAWLVGALAVTGGVSGGTGGPCAVYFDEINPANLVYFFDNAQIDSDHAVEIYVPQGRKLIFHFYGQPNNQTCTANAQVRRMVQKP